MFVSGDDPFSFFFMILRQIVNTGWSIFSLVKAEQDIDYRFLCDSFFPPLAVISAEFCCAGLAFASDMSIG